MADPKVLTGAIALIKVNGVVIGKMKNIQITENYTRIDVRGLGTIVASEAAVTQFQGQLTCSFMSVQFLNGGIPGSIDRQFVSAQSQVSQGLPSFEDQLILSDGVQIDVFKKVKDVVLPNGDIKPKLIPYFTVYECFITTDSCDVSEQQISGHNQTFQYLKPVLSI